MNDDGPELGAAETLGGTDGELERPVDDWDEGPAEGALLKLGLLILGLLEGDEDGSANQLGDPEGELEGQVDE